MFKFTRKPDPSEEERLAVAIARSLSLQAAAGGADSSGNNNPTTAQPGNAPEGTTPPGLNSPKVEIRRSVDAEDSSLAYLGDLDSDTPPSLPEFSMKVGNKTPGKFPRSNAAFLLTPNPRRRVNHSRIEIRVETTHKRREDNRPGSQGNALWGLARLIGTQSQSAVVPKASGRDSRALHHNRQDRYHKR